ncbi:WD-repeat protein, putative [Eimeria mitis]|uniref:Intraflagellar transport protein 122 homolog n=1 Tax=Eimeria mitis TaxID=44415 RepID=U6JZB1_9EIME|nr:WD-repeat protein, putative [Eimeria mitis]CDJ30789.1 WD-repeat protein, putative [Eimeria mitis]
MEASLLWRQRAARGEDAGITLWSVACSPDGSRIAVGVGFCVILVDAESGDTLQTLSGHKGNVNAIAYASSGKQFASGGADKQIILWASTGEILRHFAHSGSVQALAFNPRTLVLASGTTEELCLWYDDGSSGLGEEESSRLGSRSSFFSSKSLGTTQITRSNSRTPGSASSILGNAIAVGLALASGNSDIKSSQSSSGLQRCDRIKISSRICVLSWDDEGRRLAAGQYNGLLVVHDSEGSKIWSHQLDAPVWALAWRPSNSGNAADQGSVLVACTFEPRVWLFDADAKAALRSTQLTYDPLYVEFAPKGEYFILVGVDGGISLWSYKGICLQPLDFSAEKPEVTACCFLPSGQRIALTTREGDLGIAQLRLPVVHGLYREVYARRTALCEVTVRNLLTDMTTTIQFDELVYKIAVYKFLLAVQLKECVIIAEVCSGDSGPLEYREVRRLMGSFECSLMLLTANSVVLCKGNTLRLQEIEGSVKRQWTLRASVRYIRVLGGPPGAETLLVGLKNGEALYVYVHQELPLPLLHHRVGIVCMDVSAERNRLAIIDEEKELCIYDMPSKNRSYSQKDCTSVAWHESMDDLLSFTGSRSLFIKAGSLAPQQQFCQGIVVGFLGSGDLHLSRKSFQHQKDFRAISMLNHMQLELKLLDLSPTRRQHVCKAYAYAYVQNFTGAAEEWAAAGLPQRASEMFADLRRWTEAARWAKVAEQTQKCSEATTDETAKPSSKEGDKPEEIAKGTPQQPIGSPMQRKKKMPDMEQECREAAALYAAAGQLHRACQVHAKIGDTHSMVEIMRKCRTTEVAPPGQEQERLQMHQEGEKESLGDREASAALRCAAHAFEKCGNINFAKEALLILGDKVGFLKLLIRAGRWEEALSRAEQDPEILHHVLVPWGHELFRRDQPELAIGAFRRAGREDLALKIEFALLEGAVSQKFYAQAAGRCWAIARAFANLATFNEEEQSHSACVKACDEAVTAHQSLSKNVIRTFPVCVCQFLVCYFRRLSEIYWVYFVLVRQASSVPPRAAMPPHAVLRACTFLWTHALAPLGQAVYPKLAAAMDGSEPAPLAGILQPQLQIKRQESSLGTLPTWRLPPWWNDAQDALEAVDVQTHLRLCGIRVNRRVKGIRSFLVLRLMTDAALQLRDFQTAVAACKELRKLALTGAEHEERAELELQVMAAQVSAVHDGSLRDASAALTRAPCGLCGAVVPLLTAEAVPLGADLSCGKCGSPITMEFGTFAPITAVEFSMCKASEEQFADISSLPTKDIVSDELFLAAVRGNLLHLRAAASYDKKRSFGPLEFQPPSVTPDVLLNQPPEKVLRRTNNYLEGAAGSRTLRLLRLPQTAAEQALSSACIAERATTRYPETLMTCGTCSHLFIHPPAHRPLLRGDMCTLCSTKGSLTPIIQCHALTFGQQ